eukprot:m.30520 g.30520  ORF g.30520 m.30520 type:complete len:345 (+) comp9248_c1_seq1:242-1276(+)
MSMLQNAVAKSIRDKRESEIHRVVSALRPILLLKELGVDLDHVQRAEATGFGNCLGHVMGLAEAKAPTDLCARRGCDDGIASINVVAHVQWSVTKVVQQHLHHLADAVAVHVVHGKRLDVQIAQYIALFAVEVAQADIGDLLWSEAGQRGQPLAAWHGGGVDETHEKSHGHAMHVARGRGHWGVEVGMGINPHYTCLWSRGKNSRQRAQRDAVVAAEGQHKVALGCVPVNSVLDLLAGAAHSLREPTVAGPCILDGGVTRRLKRQVSRLFHTPAKFCERLMQALFTNSSGATICTSKRLPIGHGSPDNGHCFRRREKRRCRNLNSFDSVQTNAYIATHPCTLFR